MKQHNVRHAAQTTRLPPHETSRRQFWFDENPPEGSRNLSRSYPPIEKLGLVMTDDAPGESRASSFCASILRLPDKKYRMYYTATGEAGNMWIAVAESDDGLRWTKPPLGQYRHQGRETNRIVLDGLDTDRPSVAIPQVVCLPDGTLRMYFWHHEKRFRYKVAHGTDGLRWRVGEPDRLIFIDTEMERRSRLENGWHPDQELPKAISAELWHLKRLRSNDAAVLYYNDILKRFEYYAQWLVPQIPDRHVAFDNIANGCRCIQRRLSADGLVWTDPELILTPDARDPWDMQFYHLAVQWHEDWMIGSLGHYRVEEEQQTQDLELVFSRDGRSWSRPLRGGFIPRGNPGAPDGEGIYPPSAWIEHDDHWLCLYQATPWKHRHVGVKDPEVKGGVMAARWPKHRFLGLSEGKTTGGFLSDVFVQHDVERGNGHCRRQGA